ncbi:hypothetical protein KFK09_013466 [Dendrobium nobile]|uniref:Aminotransferase-like plant mobile domain-containing protein n=1 Tax=Dendrobium nobile TaxID=94219 RepID=A0A8T3B8V2_DENNO|nr:hypothetical protein KFK09_013466 [Dendrobium nobile]
MAERTRRRRGGRRSTHDENVDEPIREMSIASLGSSHRAHNPDQASPLVASTHLRTAREWSVECPRMIYVLRNLGLHNIRHLQFIRLDHNLITALVERWCPLTNTFHFTVGEMTITLQDVQVILGLRIDGPAVVGPNVVGLGRRWESWPDCCDELLGTHPGRDTVYHAPGDEDDTATFRMGSSQFESMLPLRWLRWTFYRDSYEQLAPGPFLYHVRAYILFMIGCFLIPDTSRSHVSLQWLPLLMDVDSFGQLSIGSAVLVHLYRELCNATRPTRTYIAGCVALLQVWSWERLYIGRPTLRVPQIHDLGGRPLGCRWAKDRIRELPSGNTLTYRDEFDGLRLSQVSMTPYTDDILATLPAECLEGIEIWRARVPLISWKRTEWHLPDRVMRQFGGIQFTDVRPMELNFRRIDGRGRADLDWTVQYRDYLEIWEDRRAYVVAITRPEGTGNQELGTYLRWYMSWASIYLLQPQTEPPETFFPRSPGERLVLAVDQVSELSARVQRSVYIDYTTFDTTLPEMSQTRDAGIGSHGSQGPRRSTSDAPSRSRRSRRQQQTEREPPRHSMHIPSSAYDMFGAGPSTQHWSPLAAQETSAHEIFYGTPSQHPSTQTFIPIAIPEWMSGVGLPTSPSQQDILLMGGQTSEQYTDVRQHRPELPPQDEEFIEEEQQLQRRRRRAPDRYTPGSRALPRHR